MDQPHRSQRATIVVGVDGSEDSRRALDYAVALAEGLDALVVAVHVVEAGATKGSAPLESGGRTIPTLVSEGHSVSGLLAAADRADAALVVVGHRGGGGFPELMLGSTSHQLARHCRRPLLVVPAGPATRLPGPRAPIVVGVDGSSGSQAALGWAAAVAAAHRGGVVAVHALDLAPAVVFGPAAGDAYRTARAGVDEAVSKWCGPLREAGVTHRVVVEEGGAAMALIRAAHDAGASLLVAGSRGAGGFPGLGLGSVADQIAHYARLPVVVVPPGDTPPPSPDIDDA